MQTFKKISISIISFFLILVSLFAIIVEPMIQNGWYYYCDGKYRNETAGQYEVLFMGSSDGQAAFVPSVFKENTNLESYNLSGANNTFESEYYMLQKEIARNSVTDVILQVDYETFSVNYEGSHRDGNSVTAIRTNNVYERINFIVKETEFDEWQDICSRMLTYGTLSWIRKITGDTSSNFVPEYKGWHRLESNDISLTKEVALKKYNTQTVETKFRDDRIKEFGELIEFCKNNNINITVIMVPMADWYVWTKSNWDELYRNICDICDKNNVPYIDFNLLKNRYECFNDKTTFKDSVHVSELGAMRFTNVFSDVFIKTKKGEAIDDMFYSSYDDMKNDSPYMRYLQ